MKNQDVYTEWPGSGRGMCRGWERPHALRGCRVGSAALVAPTPGTPRIQNISGADISLICAGYKPDQLRITR